MLQRGAALTYLHFHSYPMTTRASIENTQALVHVLQQGQPPTKLLLAPLAEFQKKIVTDTPPAYRVILYRRAMYQIADRIARKKRSSALITGESLGQVASQTVENMTVTSADLNRPVFRPLVGMDKQEIIEQAKKIGTYELSIQPYEDCCSLLLPNQVETRAQLRDIREIEATLQWDTLLDSVIDGIEEVQV